RPAALRLALAQGFHRRGLGRLLGGEAAGGRARVGGGRRRLTRGGSWSRCPPHPRPVLAAGGGPGRPPRPCGGARLVAKSLLETPWAIAIDPARRDGRVVAESAEEEREAKRVALPSSLDPAFVEALQRAGVERLYSHQRQALETAAHSNLV